MKNLFLLIFLCFSINFSFAQNEKDAATSAQIDEQVWKHFKEAYSTYDAEKYISLHTADVLRVTKWGIKKGPAFKESILKAFSREEKPQRNIDFQFEHRIYQDGLAYEVGYYKSVNTNKDGEQKTYYGRFHVVLKKINGQWKIAQDWDTENVNGREVNAADFERLAHKQEEKQLMDLDKKHLDKVKRLDTTIETLYAVISGEKGEKRDWDLFRYLFHADAKLIPTGKNKEGKTKARYLSTEDYVEASGKWLEDNGFFEKEIYRKTESFGSITQVFSTYESFRSKTDKAPFMRGINSIQLLNDGNRWWIVNIYWTHETEDMPIPEKYLEK